MDCMCEAFRKYEKWKDDKHNPRIILHTVELKKPRNITGHVYIQELTRSP